MPKRLQKDDSSATDTYAKFVAVPFETGYGHTIGNSLRRILLSSIEGAAISAVTIEGVQHEFQPIEGVVEDVTEIVLNLKKVRIRTEANKREAFKGSIDVNKTGVIKASDIKFETKGAAVSLVNPDQVICTLDNKRSFEAEIEIKTGRGYYPGEQNKKEEQAIGVIPIDSLFSPVTKVNYTVEATRLGQRIDYDKLTLEVTTDGSILPNDAVSMSAKILRDHFSLLISFDEEPQQEEEAAVDEDIVRKRKMLDKSVEEL